MEFYEKHYIRLDDRGNIIKGFSTAFEQPINGDIKVSDVGGRHFEMDGMINPQLQEMHGIYLYRYENGVIHKKTPKEIDLEIAEIPPVTQEPSTDDYLLDLDYRLTKIELGVE